MHKETMNTSYKTNDDEVILEVDVFLSKTLNDSLYLFHYPTKPSTDECEQPECLSAKIKPKQQKVELEFSLDPDASNYDKSRGEQFAVNVDGHNPTDETFFGSNVMDKYVLTATAAQDSSSVDNYAVGLIRKGELHITQLCSALELRQNFSYMDKIDSLSKKDQASADEEKEEEAVAVTVRFEGPNAAKDKQMREKSFQFIQQRNANEPWINMNYHPLGSQVSKLEYGNLICPHTNKNVTSCNFTSEEYLKSLIPENLRRIGCNLYKDVESSVSADQPISDKIKQLMINAHVLKFSTILEQLPSDISSNSIIRLIQQIAVLVQGCWVVKSELLYTDEKSPITGTSSAYLICARDYVVYLFTQNRLITRRDVLSTIFIPDAELTNIISQIADKSDRGWEFKYPFDTEFVENNRPTVETQTIKWSLQYQSFCKFFNLGKTEKSPCSVPPRKQKRLSRSSLSEDGEESGAETSTSSHKDSKSKRMNSPKKRMNISPVKHPSKSSKPYIATLAVSPTETSPSEEIKTQLREFVEDIMQRECVVTLSSLKKHVSESSLGGLCNRSDFEQLIDEALASCGAQNLKNKWPQNTTPEPLYVFCKFGNKLDRYRDILVELFSNTARIRMNTFVKSVEDILRERISDNDSRQIFEEYCTYKSGYFYLKGTISPDS